MKFAAPSMARYRAVFQHPAKAFFSLFILCGMLLLPLPGLAGEPKIIILGFDGMDPALTRAFMEDGIMPNAVRLGRQGVFTTMKTTNPSESPVAWAVFAVGGNPAKTGIFDFLRRIPGSYYPEFATVSPSTKELLPNDGTRYAISAGIGVLAFLVIYFFLRLFTSKKLPRLVAGLVAGAIMGGAAVAVFSAWVPKELPLPVANRLGDSFWKIAGEAGIKATVIRIPVTFPAEDFPLGKLLSGLGVPDLRQTNGTFSVYTTEPVARVDTEMGGKMIHVSVMGDRVEAHALGPRNFTLEGRPGVPSPPPEVRVPFTVKILKHEKSVEVTVQGQRQTIREGTFSDFFVFDFALNPLLHIQGIAKFALVSLSPEFKLYLAPINFNPAKLPFTVRISTPPDFAPELARRLGLFKTLGWSEETWALNEGQISEELFLDDLFTTMDGVEKIIVSELARKEARLFVGVFEATDRFQHMFWRYVDENHPLYRKDEADRYLPQFKKLYARVDRIIGLVMDRFVDEDTLLIVMSDHGFSSFRKAVNINTWLVKNGYMTLEGQDQARDRNLEDLFGRGEFWPNVDWSRTKAYHLGLGQIYINLFGREPEGAVLPAEYEKLQNEIRDRLLEWRDPEDGRPVLLGAYRRQDIYHGPAFDLAPDIILGFNEGYRISWQSALGGIPKDVIVPNDRKWSGDHCSVDPSLMSGVFLANRKPSKAPEIVDIAPTVLSVFGLPESKVMDGQALY